MLYVRADVYGLFIMEDMVRLDPWTETYIEMIEDIHKVTEVIPGMIESIKEVNGNE